MIYKATVEISCLLGTAPYANLTKQFQIPFLPTVGLRIAFAMKKIDVDEQRTYKALATGCADSTGIIFVESVTYYPEGNANGDVLRILADPIAEQHEAGIAAYVKLMQLFYGFTVELVA